MSGCILGGSGYSGLVGGGGGGGGGGGASIWVWGAEQVGATTVTRYLCPGSSVPIAPAVAVGARAPSGGTLRRMHVQHNEPAGNGVDLVYTLRVNGVASPLTVALASTSPTGNDTSNDVVVAAGDLLDIEVTKGAHIGSSPIGVVCTFEWVA